MRKKPTRIIDLTATDALTTLLSNDFYTTTELPEYYNFSGVLQYASEKIGDKTLDQCVAWGRHPEDEEGVNLDIITNKDGRYAVRPITLANPFLYYMLARDICEEDAWSSIKECFDLFLDSHIKACAIPVVNTSELPEHFKGSTTILNWWNSVEQRSIELSLKYNYMFVTDITNCYGQINPESISWALSRKGTPYETTKNAELASRIRLYLKAMQQGRNIGIPQGSRLFSLIAEIILGYTDMLLTQKITEEKEKGKLPKNLEYEIIRYVDDYRIFCNDRHALEDISYMLQHILERFNFRMNTSKTRITSDLITDSVKPDKAFYIFNTPIECHTTYYDKKGKRHMSHRYDFPGLQKHLMYIHEFSKRFPDSGQLVTQLEAFSRRLEFRLSARKNKLESIRTFGVELSTQLKGTDHQASNETEKTKEIHNFTNNAIPMIAICTSIAVKNLRAANYALKVVSLLLSDIPDEYDSEKKEIVNSIYKKLICVPNSAFLQVWLQNITNPTDDWSSQEVYTMPLCKVVANQPVNLWNNDWLLPEIAESFPQNSVVDRKHEIGPVITFKAKREYDEMIAQLEADLNGIHPYGDIPWNDMEKSLAEDNSKNHFSSEAIDGLENYSFEDESEPGTSETTSEGADKGVNITNLFSPENLKAIDEFESSGGFGSAPEDTTIN